MGKILNFLPQKIIEYSFYLLFFLVPIILTPLNYELFEYNKMMLTYGLAVIIVGSWLIKMIINRQFILKRTPLDLPLLLFLLSQIISTFLSIDRHVSIWGYYSRFNGGLLSTISYILLYYSFVSNFPQEKIKKLLKIILLSGLLVSIYGILEHLGIDKNIWVQDVQNRVFSTLGQPNWLAAYLAVLIPITVGIGLSNLFSTDLSSSDKSQKSKVKSQSYNSKFKIIGLLDNWIIGLLVFISSIFYITLVFTKSRSGFLGFWISLIFLLLITFLSYHLTKPNSKTPRNYTVVSICGVFIFLTFLLGAPFQEINRFTLPALISNQQWSNEAMEQSIKSSGSSVIDVGITESGTIRRIVWKGAIDIFRHYPLFGTGVETFAFSYYKFRPVEHNMTSEWDFLYNKAHNEYLNYAATTGAFGLGSYLLIMIIFILWNIKKIILQNTHNSLVIARSEATKQSLLKTRLPREMTFARNDMLNVALFTAWLSILITNFFGFSVVIIQLFFYLIPAISFVLSDMSLRTEGEVTASAGSRLMAGQSNIKDRHVPPGGTRDDKERVPINTYQLAIIIFIFFVICYLLSVIYKLWYADVIFADGYHKVRSQEIAPAYQSLKKALELNEEEPMYYDEFSYPAAEMAVAFADEKEATLSAALTKEAIIASNFAVNHAPQNVNFWKSRTRVFYVLSQIDEKYYSDSLFSLQQTKILSPTDPKIRYNLGLLYDKMGKKKEAIAELEETTRLKPDYRDAFYALAYLYEKDNKRDKARESLKYILTKIATDDAEVRKKLEELK